MDHKTFNDALQYATEQAMRLHESYTVRQVKYGRCTHYQSLRGVPSDFAKNADTIVKSDGGVILPGLHK